ncbi:hypothetical protein LCGC14_0823720 [marine sediment metagenome]|uniref:Uncharacterized protein n=1 Tax=marine sediment metagenome TaxID=412755 RepID=A0A0F9PMP2_9ZZZZ|nr:hypothetical protein [Desulfobacterales bacterium]
MDTRVATILSPEDLGAAGTKIININLQDVISRISIAFKTTNVSEVMTEHPAANLTRIELIDGSDVLFSLTGLQAQALNFYDRRNKPYSYIDDISGHAETAVIGIDFGRFLYDPIMAFDPKKFISPQLKITWDEDICEVDTTVNECIVRAHIFDGKEVTPTGFITSKEIYSYLVQTSGFHYIDLPVDHVMKQLYVKCRYADESFFGLLDSARLSEENDRKIPFDLTMTELLHDALESYGYCFEHAYLNGIDTVTVFYAMPCDLEYVGYSPYGAADASAIWSTGGGKYRKVGTSTSINHKAMIMGALPHGVMPLLPKPSDNLEDWYKVPALESLLLRIKDTASVADVATAEILVSQFRPY